jgi:hypothetical protein
MSSLCNLLHHYDDGIMFPCYLGKFGNEIDSMKFPFQFRNGQWLLLLEYLCILRGGGGGGVNQCCTILTIKLLLTFSNHPK